MIRMFSCSVRSLILVVSLSVFLFVLLFSQVGDRYGYRIPKIPKLGWDPASIIGSHDKPPSAPAPEPETLKESPEDIAQAPPRPLPEPGAARPHPIDALIKQANDDFKALLDKETKGVDAAAKAYVERRGRQPPPGFDRWVKFAEENKAVMLEDFYDQIHYDLEPLGAIPGQTLREATLAWPYWISVRNGEVKSRKKEPNEDVPWLDLWPAMLKDISHLLPDVDLAMNVMDESRLLVSWDEVSRYMQLAEQEKKDKPFPSLKSDIVTTFPKLPEPTYEPEKYQHDMIRSGPIWALAREACPPDSTGRTASYEMDYKLVPSFPPGFPEGSFEGYVRNWTVATDPCIHSHLRGLHGSFIEPLSMSISRKLYPLFGGSKLPMNNEILIPPAMYWTDDPFYSGGAQHVPWEEKQNKVMWRGSATGGRNKESNWKRFQRHRFVSMLNGTQVHAASLSSGGQLDDINDVFAQNFPPPERGLYNLVTAPARKLGDWLNQIAEVAFSHLLCFPTTHDKSKCPYNEKFYTVPGHLPMKDQYQFKYLPDVDGNSFSGRYRAFLLSNSLPIKATIYREWHDSRLVPWKHFVPMDNTFKDIWGILEYFLGYDGVAESELESEVGPDDNEGPALDGHPDGNHGAEGNVQGFYNGYGSPNSPAEGTFDPGAVAGFSEVEIVEDKHRIVTAPNEKLPQATPHPFYATNSNKAKREQKRIYTAPHEAQARAIAEDGRDWSNRVLRHVDMQIYFYRLILEFARLCSDDRHRMAWVSDDHEFTAGPGPDETGTGEASVGPGYNGHPDAKAGYGAWSDGASPAIPGANHGHTTVADGGAPIDQGPGEGQAAGAKTEGVGHGAAVGPGNSNPDDVHIGIWPPTSDAAAGAHNPDLPPGRNRHQFEHGYVGAPPMAAPPGPFEAYDDKNTDIPASAPGPPPAPAAGAGGATAPGVGAHLGAAHDPAIDMPPVGDPLHPGAHLGAAVGTEGTPGGSQAGGDQGAGRFNPEGADEGGLWRRRGRRWIA